MRPIYFDVTDIIAFAMGNLRVSGIQRVQLKIIFCIASANKLHPIYCTFFHPVMKKMVMFEPLDVLSEKEFDPEFLLGRLGLLSRRLIPSKRSIRCYLSRYSNNKLLRALKKAQVYFYAFFLRSRLSAIGVNEGIHLTGSMKRLNFKIPNSVRMPYASCSALIGHSKKPLTFAGPTHRRVGMWFKWFMI